MPKYKELSLNVELGYNRQQTPSTSIYDEKDESHDSIDSNSNQEDVSVRHQISELINRQKSYTCES